MKRIPLIIETDIGRDPDDLFAILYLLGTEKVNIKAILITPGDRDQVGVARFMLDYVGLPEVPIGIPSKNWTRTQRSSGGMHYKLLNEFQAPLEQMPSATSEELVRELTTDDTQFFIIGPATGIASIEKENVSHHNRLVMQGGFCPYSLYSPQVWFRLEKFENKEFVPTFNFNGDRPAAKKIVNNFVNGSFVGKNVCHTIEYTPDLIPDGEYGTWNLGVGFNATRAKYLFQKASKIYFKKHKSKKFHDPTAAVCFLHPEIGTWIYGIPAKMESGYTTIGCKTPEFYPVPGQIERKVLVDIDREKLWEHIRSFT